MRFSVIIPAYNAESFIKSCVGSVLSQSFSDFEIIVVNDGSTDNTLNRLKEIKDNRLRVIDKKNEGVSVARNTGIQNARGEYICFLDADDEYLLNHLETLSEAIDKYHDKSFFATRFCISMIYNRNKITKPRTTGKTYYYGNIVEVLLNNPELIWTGCVCIRKDMFNIYGMFEPGVKLLEDTDMWRRIYVHTGVVCIDSITVKRNREGSEATKKYTRRYEADPLNRMPLFLNDSNISASVKKSLIITHEFTKLQVVRSYILSGEREKAKLYMRDIEKKLIPLNRWLITKFCFCIPSSLLRWYINFKNSGFYE